MRYTICAEIFSFLLFLDLFFSQNIKLCVDHFSFRFTLFVRIAIVTTKGGEHHACRHFCEVLLSCCRQFSLEASGTTTTTQGSSGYSELIPLVVTLSSDLWKFITFSVRFPEGLSLCCTANKNSQKCHCCEKLVEFTSCRFHSRLHDKCPAYIKRFCCSVCLAGSPTIPFLCSCFRT